MLLISMSGDELLKRFEQACETLTDWTEWKYQEWRKTVKKYPMTKFTVYEKYDKKDFQGYLQYIFRFSSRTLNNPAMVLVPIIDDGKDKSYLFPARVPFVLTYHMLDRYRQRMNLGDKPIRQCLGDFLYHAVYFAEIYRGENHVVMAQEDGICLGVIDNNKFILKTFVSYDMLKENQKEAYDTLSEFWEKMRAYNNNCKELGTEKYYDERKRIEFGLTTKSAKKIYAQFFEE